MDEFQYRFHNSLPSINSSSLRKIIHTLRIHNNQPVPRSPSQPLSQIPTAYSSASSSQPQHAPRSAHDPQPQRRHRRQVRETQAFRLPNLHGSSRGPCSSHFCNAHASRWPSSEFALRFLSQALLAVVDVREPWVALLELLLFGDGLSSFASSFAGLCACGLVS